MTYENVIERFTLHFVGRSNTIFEHARFNRRVQAEKESVIDFIEDLYKLAETCQFVALKDELIRDRIVVGIQNANLSQKLMQDEKLTLEKAVKEAKSSEHIKQHHKTEERYAQIEKGALAMTWACEKFNNLGAGKGYSY